MQATRRSHVDSSSLARRPAWAALACLLGLLAGLSQAPAANIVWVTDNSPAGFSGPLSGFNESGWYTLLQNAGHNVNSYNPPNDPTLMSAADIAALNTNDLIIIGRSLASAAFQGTSHPPQWNVQITRPILCVNIYAARQNRLGWFVANEANGSPTTVTAVNLADETTAYIFSEVALNGSTTVDPYDEAIGQNTSQTTSLPVTGGRVLATNASGWKIIAEWPAGTAVRGGADVLGGYRMFFAAANREPSGGTVPQAGFENLTATGESMFLKAVEIAANNGQLPYDPTWPVGFKTQPQSLDLLENNPATFSAIVTGAPPRALQWERSDGLGGFTNIPGATSGIYTIPLVTPADDGAQFRLTVTNAFSTATSEPAILNVQRDIALPTIVGIQVPATFTHVIVSFSEKIAMPDPEVNFSSETLNIFSRAVDSTGTNVILTTGFLDIGSSHILTVTEVTDLAAAPNTIVTTNVTVLAPVITCGYIRGDYYLGLTGSTVDLLTNSAKYQTSYPDVTRYYATFNSQANFADNYGLRMWGWFVPPTNGNYTIYVRSDDSSRVYFSLNDAPANESLIALQNGANVEYTNTAGGTPRFSTVANLVAGQRYFVEAFVKEGTGGDYLTVVAKAEGEPWPVSTNAATVNPVPGRWFCSYADPNGVRINVTNQPASVSVSENIPVTFTVGADIGPADRRALVLYQWQRNGLDIPGATAASYSIAAAALADNGASYQCVITVPGVTVVSSTAVLTVDQDTAPPQLLSMGSLNGRQIGLVFNEWLEEASATDVGNYFVNAGNAGIVSAMLRPDRKTVVLTLDNPLPPGYSVAISYLKDIASTPNEVGYLGQTLTDGTVVRATWLNQDIGPSATDPIYPGSIFVGTNNGSLAMRAGGTDIWGTADAMHYVHDSVTGDFEAIVRVQSLLYVDPSTKCGILARESLAPGSRNVGMVVMPPPPGRNLNVLQWRDDNGGGSVSRHRENSPDAPTNSPAWPNAWLKLQRQGPVFTGSFSSNAVDWVVMGARTNANLPATLVVGLGATSHNNTSTNNFTEALFADYQLRNPQADLALAKTGPGASVVLSNPVTFTLTVTNQGPGSATNVVLTDSLPAGLTFVSAVSGQGTCTAAGNQVACTLGTLDPATSVTVTLEARATGEGLQVNTASVTSTTGDPNLADNAAAANVTVITPVRPVLDLASLVYSGTGDGEFSGSFATQAGFSYIVEYKDALSDATWTELTTIVGDGTDKSFTDPGPLPATRFYRVRLVGP